MFPSTFSPSLVNSGISADSYISRSATNSSSVSSASSAGSFHSQASGISSFSNGSSQQLSRTIFLGDLSIYCTEKDICQVFSSFGAIESIHLKRIPQGQTHYLSYGFIRYQTRQSAEHALAALDGVVFLGRPLRLGWAADYRDGFHAKKDGFMKSVQPPHAQIHITFASMHGKIVTESALRDIFERFGEVKDVSIKKIHFSRESGQQTGYGFIHYPLDERGINSAVTAVKTLNETTVDNIYLRCTVSHGLSEHLKASPPTKSCMEFKPSTSFSSTSTISPPFKLPSPSAPPATSLSAGAKPWNGISDNNYRSSNTPIGSQFPSFDAPAHTYFPAGNNSYSSYDPFVSFDTSIEALNGMMKL